MCSDMGKKGCAKGRALGLGRKGTLHFSVCVLWDLQYRSDRCGTINYGTAGEVVPRAREIREDSERESICKLSHSLMDKM